MSVSLYLNLDTKEVNKVKKALTGKQADKLIASSAKTALKTGKSVFLSREKGGAPSIYNIKKSEIEKSTKIKRNALVVEERRLTIGMAPSHYSMTPKKYTSQKGKKISKRPKATVTIKKGQKKSFRHGFVVNPSASGFKGGHVMLWERDGEMIGPVRSISPAQMLSNTKVAEKVEEAMQDRFNDRLHNGLKRKGLVE